ncbi:MAG: TrmO family methyltransferase domain-containing protein [Dissulfurimicrobium sp.]|uniref:TrmO family methyltransferase domain-containing protein n=1 Tax=Dissulfurimicrobium sp. TaxID=2022436 RepID=UPI00404AF307
MDGILVGQEILILTWLHLAERDVLKVHPRGNDRNSLKGVFATRSPDRPNPIGLHQARVLEIAEGHRLRVDHLEALNGTPIVDLKPVLKEYWR